MVLFDRSRISFTRERDILQLCSKWAHKEYREAYPAPFDLEDRESTRRVAFVRKILAPLTKHVHFEDVPESLRHLRPKQWSTHSSCVPYCKISGVHAHAYARAHACPPGATLAAHVRAYACAWTPLILQYSMHFSI